MPSEAQVQITDHGEMISILPNHHLTSQDANQWQGGTVVFHSIQKFLRHSAINPKQKPPCLWSANTWSIFLSDAGADQRYDVSSSTTVARAESFYSFSSTNIVPKRRNKKTKAEQRQSVRRGIKERAFLATQSEKKAETSIHICHGICKVKWPIPFRQ